MWSTLASSRLGMSFRPGCAEQAEVLSLGSSTGALDDAPATVGANPHRARSKQAKVRTIIRDTIRPNACVGWRHATEGPNPVSQEAQSSRDGVPLILTTVLAGALAVGATV